MKHLDNIPVWLFALLTVIAFDAAAWYLVCTRAGSRVWPLYAPDGQHRRLDFFAAILAWYAIAIDLIAVAIWETSNVRQRRFTATSAS